MSTPARYSGGRAWSLFLVERYLPAASARGLPAAVARAASLAVESGRRGAGSAPADQVQYLSSAYLPTEDTCFCLFRATTADLVRALNDEAGFAVDRITAAVLLHPTTQDPDDPEKELS